MGQSGNDYSFRVRTGSGNSNGSSPQLEGGSVSSSQVQHVVMTIKHNGLRKLYVNGSQVASLNSSDDFYQWDRNYKFALANELTQDRPWLGDLYLVAIYNDELTPSQITQNFQAGYASGTPTGGQTPSGVSCNWNEDFSGLSYGDMSDNGNTSWTAAYTGSSTEVGISNGEFRGNGLISELVWASDVVNISGAPNAYITLTARSHGPMEPADYMKFYYKIDNGSEILFDSRYDNFNNDNDEQISVSGLSGNSLQLIVKMYNTSTAETFYLDDVEINCGSFNGAVLPPSLASCSSGNLTWNANVHVNGSSTSTDLRLKESSKTNEVIYDANLPSAFNGPVEVSIDEAISWDGYDNRINANQPFEQWRVVFLKNGNIDWSSDYTADLADFVKSAEWKGSLGTAVLPSGADKIIIAHIGDNTYGNGNTQNSANSVVPSSICISYTALPCDNFTSGGQIAGDETGCGTYDPAPITSVLLPSGGSGPVEYVWLQANEPIRADGSNATMVPNSNSETIDPGPISQTTYYRRCARRVGCTTWDGESNDIVKEVLVPPSALVATTDPTCTGADGSITFTFTDNSDRTNIEFSLDGGQTFPLYVSDAAGTASFTGLTAGDYDLVVRWGNDECPVSLGTYTLSPGTTFNPLTISISSDLGNPSIRQEFEVRDMDPTHSCFSNDPFRFLYLKGLLDNIVGNGYDNRFWYLSGGGHFTEYTDGTALFTAEATSVVDTSLKLDVYVELSDYATTAPSQSPKTAMCNQLDFSDAANFTYYQTFSGTLIGKGGLAGAVLTLDRMGPSWQQGYNANVISPGLGSSAWFHLYLQSQPNLGPGLKVSSNGTYDFNLELDPISPDVQACGSATLSANIISGQGAGLSYSWSGPNGFTASTATVTVTESGTYTLTVFNNGCPVQESVDVSIQQTDPPIVDVEVFPGSCNLNDGEIRFTFPDDPNRTNIEFSLDGGLTYSLLSQDDAGSASFTGLSAQSYDLFVRWGNEDCPRSLGIIDLRDSCFNSDFGDAPRCYGVAEHPYREGSYLGSLWDGEESSAYSNDAKGDDDSVLDDEDGVTFIGGASGKPGETKQLTVVVTQTADNQNYLAAWIDFNQNCEFDPAERIIDNHQVSQASSPQTFTFTYTVPADALPGNTYARFRLAADPMDFADGTEVSGEVEDYEFNIGCNIDLVLGGEDISCGKPSATLDAEVSGASAAFQGLNFAYYEVGNLSQLPDFSSLTPQKTGIASNFDIGLRSRDEDFAFEFYGYINILEAGSYDFYTSSDDGSKLFIGSQEVVDNDGLHSNRERSGSIQLTAGLHPIRVTFFERGGNQVLQVKYEGPNVTKQIIPDNVLFSSQESGVTYSWTGPGGFTSTEEDPEVFQAGTYVLTLSDTTFGCQVLDSIRVNGVADTILDAGEIGPDEYLCGEPYIPDTMRSMRDADGGGSPVAYRWLVTEDLDAPLYTWWVKKGADKSYLTFDGPITKTCWFIRQARACDTAEWVNSNVAGVIKRNQPRPKFSISYPEGTCVDSTRPLTIHFDAKKWGSRSNIYTWFFPGSNDTDGELQGPADPVDKRRLNVKTTYSAPGTYEAYLTLAFAPKPGAPLCDSPLMLTFTIDDAKTCDNITDAGIIFGSQASCAIPFEADSIGGPGASGGSGANIEYFWIYTQNPLLPPTLWSMVPGSMGPDKEYIDPSSLLGGLDRTTYFIRCARRVSCDAHLESNAIVIEVDPAVRQKCTAMEMSGVDYSFKLPGMDIGSATDQYRWFGEEGKLTTYADGSAKLEGLIENIGNANLKFYVEFILDPVMDWQEWHNDTASRAGDYYPNILGDEFTHTTWDYYRIDTDRSRLVGFAFYGGDTLKPINTGLSQVGVGANGENLNYGIYSEFDFVSVSGQYSGKASFQNDFMDCTDVCPNPPRVSARVMLNGAYNESRGEMVPRLGPNRFLAMSQPFGLWGYQGDESIDSLTYYFNPRMNDVVTWVLIELRTYDNLLELQGRKAGLLLRDGSIVGTDLSSLVELEANPYTAYYIGARTLGYFGVLTDVAKTKLGRVLTVDFTKKTNVFQVYNEAIDPAMLEIAPGIFGLIEGDVLGEGNVDGPDIQAILNEYNKVGQSPADLDVNGVVDGLDIQRALQNIWKKTNMLDWTSQAETD